MGKRIKRQTIKHIPQDIIEDILVNLPVESLLRFKCVSKQWHSLISSKHFTKYYVKKSTDLIRHNLIYRSYDYTKPYRTSCSRSLRSCSLKSFLDEQKYEDDSTVTTSYHDAIVPNSGCLEDIVGSCNGLILISSRISKYWYDLILWNPSTRQVKIIPPPRYYARRKSYRRSDQFVYGFGYDDSTDYKVVIIFVTKAGAPYSTQMYSLRTNSWKKIGDFEKGYLCGYSGTHVKGKLHWLVEEGGFGGNKIIVSLSLVDGKYDIVSLPPLEFSKDDLHCYYTLHDSGGYLSLMRNGTVFVEVWVMMEYGEVESWTNSSNLRGRMRTFHLLTSRPIWLKKNGDIVVTISKSESHSEVHVYDEFGYRVYAVDAEILQHDIYIESLVSPFGDEKLCQ